MTMSTDFNDFDASWGVWLTWNGAGIHLLAQQKKGGKSFHEKISSDPCPWYPRFQCAVCKKASVIYGNAWDHECPYCGSSHGIL